MEAVESAINRLVQKLEGNVGDLEALETICATLRESTNSSHNSASTKLRKIIIELGCRIVDEICKREDIVL
jgi:hypothetical protein